MRIHVRYFAVLKDLFGLEGEEMELPAGASVRDLLGELRMREVAGLKSALFETIAVAVNQEYARADAVLSEGDEVALLPPVSGGCDEMRGEW